MYFIVSVCFNYAYPIVPGAVDILKQSKTPRKRKCSFSMDEVMHTCFLVLENNSNLLRVISKILRKPF